MLELIDIVHYYGKKKLLDGVDLTLGENEVLCLLGPSGSGKSTILKIIAGFEKPSGGSVLYNGKDLLNEPVYKRNFGMVFQDYALFPHMSVYDNIAFGLKMKKESGPEADKKVRNAMKQVGMEKFGDRKVTDLSGGEQQRVALARSLVVRPALLMLDEPLGALDYSLRQSLIGELHEILGKNGIPSIYVTHDQNEAMSLSDRIAILHDGRIIQTAAPEELFTHPETAWCASFLGFHNFINGQAAAGGEISLRNFSKEIRFRSQTGMGPGTKVRILIKDGMIGSERAEKSDHALVLDAIPLQNIYRGDYYDVLLKIDGNCEITLRSRDKVPTELPVQVICPKDRIIVYPDRSEQ